MPEPFDKHIFLIKILTQPVTLISRLFLPFCYYEAALQPNLEHILELREELDNLDLELEA